MGHSNDDINALLGRWSMLLQKNNFSTIPFLINSFMDVEFVPTIPHLVEEVFNFKSFIECSIIEGGEVLFRHTKAQQSKFYLDSSGCLVLKYKLFCTDMDKLPKEVENLDCSRKMLKVKVCGPVGCQF